MTRAEFSAKTRAAAFQRCAGKCESAACGNTLLRAGKFAYDHIIPAALGGEATLENCQVLCLSCHGAKTGGEDIPRISKAVRQHLKHIGARAKSSRPMAGSRASGWKRGFNKPAERRP